MNNYLNLLVDVKSDGVKKEDRTGTGTTSIFGRQLRWDLSKGLPVVTTKKLHLKSIIHELLWFLNGETNIQYLKDNSVKIWDDWADENGDLGPVYGKQWVAWEDTRVVGENEFKEIYEARGYVIAGYVSYADDITPFSSGRSHSDDTQVVIRREINQIERLVEDLKNNPCLLYTSDAADE